MRLFLVLAGFCCLAPGTTATLANSPENGGQCCNLKRSYECRRDRRQYDDFYTYGYCRGGRWCGRYMPGGYYVYKDGVWYICANQRTAPPRLETGEQSEAARQVGEE